MPSEKTKEQSRTSKGKPNRLDQIKIDEVKVNKIELILVGNLENFDFCHILEIGEGKKEMINSISYRQNKVPERISTISRVYTKGRTSSTITQKAYKRLEELEGVIKAGPFGDFFKNMVYIKIDERILTGEERERYTRLLDERGV